MEMSNLCLCLRRALEEGSIRGIHFCEVFVSLTLTTFRSSLKKPYQNLIIICPCVRGLRSNIYACLSMLLSSGVRAIIYTPGFPVLKSQRNLRTKMKHEIRVSCPWNSHFEHIHPKTFRDLRNTKSLRNAHVRARGSALHAKRTKRLLDAIKPWSLSCYPPETSPTPQILKQ